MVTPLLSSVGRSWAVVAKSTNKAYLVPENVTPSELDCVTFFFPDDPLYKQQLMAAYLYFGQWTAWERGRNNIGSLAASAWKEAIQRSMEANFMAQVTVNNNIESGSCGCCGGGSNDLSRPSYNVVIDETTTLDQPEPNGEQEYVESPTAPTPPAEYIEEFPTWVEFDEQKCKAANYFAGRLESQLEQVRYIFNNFIEVSTTSVLARLAATLADGPLPVVDVAVVATFLVPRLIDWINDKAGDTSDISAFLLTLDKCEITQLIYDAQTKGGLFSSLNTYLSGKVSSSSMSDTTKGWINVYINYVFGQRWADMVLDGISSLVPDSVTIDCPCGAQMADVFLDFEDQTNQGMSFSLAPFLAGSTTQGIESVNQIEGDHSLYMQIAGSWSGQTTQGAGGTWTYNLPNAMTLTDGDQFSIHWKYMGDHKPNLRMRVNNTTTPILEANTLNTIVGNHQDTLSVSAGPAEDGLFITRIEFQFIETGEVASPAGRLIVDEVSMTIENFS